MERIQSINPARIRWCCNDRGITPEELASKVDIAQSTIDKVMAGEAGLSFNQLHNIAKFFNRGTLFFLEAGSVQESQVRSAQYRTIANQKPDLSPELKALIERSEAQRDMYLALREDLEEEANARFEPPDLPAQSPKRAATIAREWLGLHNANDFATYREAVENKGILVFQSMGYFGAWRIPPESAIAGFSLYHHICPVILVKKQTYSTRQSFTLMHELGHILLHRNSFIDEEEDLYTHRGRERTANAFAGHLLVPDEFLSQIDDDGRPPDVAGFDDWLKPFRKQWGVSAEVILRRLTDAGRLDQAKYRRYRNWWSQQHPPEQEGGNRQYRAREPLHIFGGRFVRTVLDALHAREISLHKASKYLDNLKIKDVHKLESYIARV